MVEGHNSGVDDGQLKTVVERIERLEEEIADLNEGKSEIYKEAKSNGFDVKIIRKIIAIRRKDQNLLREEEEILDLYKSALGMA